MGILYCSRYFGLDAHDEGNSLILMPPSALGFYRDPFAGLTGSSTSCDFSSFRVFPFAPPFVHLLDFVSVRGFCSLRFALGRLHYCRDNRDLHLTRRALHGQKQMTLVEIIAFITRMRNVCVWRWLNADRPRWSLYSVRACMLIHFAVYRHCQLEVSGKMCFHNVFSR